MKIGGIILIRILSFKYFNNMLTRDTDFNSSSTWAKMILYDILIMINNMLNFEEILLRTNIDESIELWFFIINDKCLEYDFLKFISDLLNFLILE